MGLQFHETMYGKNFFECQLPMLTEVLTRIADAEEKKLQMQPEKPVKKNHLLTQDTVAALTAIINCPKKAERLGEIICTQVLTDDESPEKVGSYAAQAILNGSINDLLLAICGWTVAGLLEKMPQIDCEACKAEGGCEE